MNRHDRLIKHASVVVAGLAGFTLAACSGSGDGSEASEAIGSDTQALDIPLVSPSCIGDSQTECQGQSCCTNAPVPAGTYNYPAEPAYPDWQYPAEIHAFEANTYEVTVGRFRKFVAQYNGTPPIEGAGAPPPTSLDDNSWAGWSSDWNQYLPATQAALKQNLKCNSVFQTWTDSAGANETRPINCVNYYEAFAFCVWDRSRLPTEPEWRFMASGGTEQRTYPWGATTPTTSRAAYACSNAWPATYCSLADIAVVGSKPSGAGRWGHRDLAGNVSEWNLDYFAPPFETCYGGGGLPVPCESFRWAYDNEYRVAAGGGFDGTADEMKVTERFPEMVAKFPDEIMMGVATRRNRNTGFRCARTK